ncbi:MAG: energy-coupling factor ABC transporter permease [Nitrospirae bacterium]|nr:energy-coupling factor ABC transporter permease [Nitrospirota bacterium]
MTHLHIPDGILPVGLWVLGLIVMVFALGFSLFRLRGMDRIKKIPLLGAVSAVMLVAMSLEILPLAYHINLSVVAGILLGPALGFLAAFITNLMLALMGHGGITVIGLNTLLLGSEAVLGHTLFYLLKDRLPVFWSAAVATVLTLFMTTLALISIVAVSHASPELMSHGDEHGLLQHGQMSVRMFAIMVVSLGSIGWTIEAAITGAVVRFISQVKPDLLDHALHRERAGR